MAERSCECRDWTKWANDPFFPIWFNPRTNEYVLISGRIAADCTVIYYCMFCGGSMPKSGRAEFFTIPSDEDLADGRMLLGRITDVMSMRSILGEPYDIFDWWTDESGELIRNPDAPVFKRQYRYRSRWKTVEVTIQEFRTGISDSPFAANPRTWISLSNDLA